MSPTFSTISQGWWDLRREGCGGSGTALAEQMRSRKRRRALFEVPFERSSERNKLRRRADGKVSAVEPEHVSRQVPSALFFYSLTETACGAGAVSGVGIVAVGEGVPPFLKGRSSSE